MLLDVPKESPRPAPPLPLEIWTQIFKHTTICDYLVDYSPAAGLYSHYLRDLRFRKGLLLVCRSWYMAGLSRLYRDVVFRRCTQISPFVETLRQIPHVQHLVKSMMFIFFVPLECHQSFEQDLQDLWEVCPGLTRLDYHMSLVVLGPSIPSPMFPMSASITHLALGDLIPWNTIHDCLDQLRDVLVSLRVTLWNIPSYRTRALSFPRLTSLEIKTILGRSYTIPDISTIISQWDASALTNLTLRIADQPFSSDLAFLDFLRKCGRRITFLQLDMDNNDQRFLDLCPNLDHLVVRPTTHVSELTHPKVKWVDIWPMKGGPSPEPANFDKELPGLPALLGVRLFDASLYPFRPLVLAIPPDLSIRTRAGHPPQILEDELPQELCACWIQATKSELMITSVHPIVQFTKSNDEIVQELLDELGLDEGESTALVAIHDLDNTNSPSNVDEESEADGDYEPSDMDGSSEGGSDGYSSGTDIDIGDTDPNFLYGELYDYDRADRSWGTRIKTLPSGEILTRSFHYESRRLY
ncbi:hypothetical protein BDN72DRAFT_76950 [Pluteus cervinus]|uniref:Uncharacterized protein n=1 Tax=Pluteus cervinus TaxID=181527 RepID=A0ACD3B8G2_9AGAR|nr:hypothetical protein BDN72DRAFT_76950 [Pluteus cervinus]